MMKKVMGQAGEQSEALDKLIDSANVQKMEQAAHHISVEVLMQKNNIMTLWSNLCSCFFLLIRKVQEYIVILSKG